jgi:SAM-dependent methyltransferase
MTIEEAIGSVAVRFPFPGYVTPEAAWGHRSIATTVLRYLPPGGKILDFGCGPCDKTAVVQALGYKCSGYDDLQDDWHRIEGNREKILAFAAQCGIDFRPAETGPLPFPKASSDMVMLHDVLEHLHDPPREILNDLLELVVPGGLLFVTVPNAVNIRKRLRVLLGKTNLPAFDYYYWSPGPWRGHIREYVADDLITLAQYLDLEPLELSGRDHMLRRLPAPALAVYRCVTRLFGSWKDSWALVARKKPNWSPRRALPREEFLKIFGRYAPLSVCDGGLPQE